jgi:hypothetical protein
MAALSQGSDLSEQPSEARTAAELAQLHSDRWLSQVVNGIRSAASTPEAGVQEALFAIRSALAGLTITAQPVPGRVRKLLDVLSLPLWRQRHALYSAWLLTLIVNGAGRHRLRLLADQDGRLEFSFSGSHIGYVDSDRGRLEIWAELRQPYANPVGKGRKAAVQPDYVLRLSPLTSPKGGQLVVEAKQYLRGKKSNLLNALVDYARRFPECASDSG